MNIGAEVLELSALLGIDAISTGGGFDFPWFSAGSDGPNITVVTPDEGLGPKELDEPAHVNFCVDMEWLKLDSYRFETTKSALVALANPDFRAAVMWEGLGQVENDLVDGIIEEFIAFSAGVDAKKVELDLTMSQLSQLIIASSGGTFVENVGY